MINNYIKILIRYFLNDGMYTFIIVFGMAIGIAACLMIAQYVHFEMSFDQHVKDRDLIYYSYMHWSGQDRGVDGKCFPAIAPLCDQSIPEVESSVRIAPVALTSGSTRVLRREQNGKVIFYREVDDLYLADPGVLKFFSVPLLAGDAESALNEPNTMVITSSLADRFFPNEDPINKTLVMQFGEMGRIECRITGVAEDPAPNSSLQFNGLYSMETLKAGWDIDNAWTIGEFQTFIKLHPGFDFKLVESKINKQARPIRDLEAKLNLKLSIHLYPFADFHFFKHHNTSTTEGIQFSGDKKLLVYFVILAGLILIISWGNYINLTTARALRRAKEVSLRKVNGASRKNLVFQFLIEFLFLNIVSVLLALTITQLLFSEFAQIIGSDATWIFWTKPFFWLVITLLIAFSTAVSGVYPAFIMSDYKPAIVLKGNFRTSQSGLAVRKGLVLVQFGLSVFMIMSIYVISRQLFFMQRKDIGMAIDQLLVVKTNELDLSVSRAAAFQQLKSKVENIDYIKNISAASMYPGHNNPRLVVFHLTADAEKKPEAFLFNEVGENYFSTMEMEFLYGRDFQAGQPSDSTKVVINEKCARDLGFDKPQSAIGEQMTLTEFGKKFEIIGVVKDFNLNLKLPTAGEVFFKSSLYDYFLLKLSTDNIRLSIAEIEKEWKLLFSDAPFDYFFLDTYFDTFYREEQRFAGVFGFFSIIGILITCMGLFGLSLYDTSSRTKEIGIRKSLGASVRSIMWLFSKDYLKLVLMAALVGIPAGIFLLNEWLKNYPSRINLQADAVLFPLAIMFCIAIFTVGYHTFKTANMDPVKSLRNE